LKIDKTSIMQKRQNKLNPVPKDTSPKAYSIYHKILASLSPQQRLEMVFELSENVRAIAVAGLRKRHPEFTDQQIAFEIIHKLYGVDLR
jgi:hypothetical protein